MGGLSHDQYLDEPAETIDWMLALDRMRAEVERAQMEKAQEAARARAQRNARR